jgi:hypothetical protein
MILDHWVEIAMSILPDGKLGTEYMLHPYGLILHGCIDLETATRATSEA